MTRLPRPCESAPRPSTARNGGSWKRVSRPRYLRTRGRAERGSSREVRKRCRSRRRARRPRPGGRGWTLALLADAVVALTPHARVSRHTVGRRLAENDLKPWQQKMWCVPKIDAEYVARMEDVLDLYTHRPAAGTAVVCVDESPRQLIGGVRPTTPVAPGYAARQDYEYCRN